MYTIVSLYTWVVLNVHNSFTIHRGGIKCTQIVSLCTWVVLNVHNSFTIHRGGIKCTQ